MRPPRTSQVTPPPSLEQVVLLFFLPCRPRPRKLLPFQFVVAPKRGGALQNSLQIWAPLVRRLQASLTPPPLTPPPPFVEQVVPPLSLPCRPMPKSCPKIPDVARLQRGGALRKFLQIGAPLVRRLQTSQVSPSLFLTQVALLFLSPPWPVKLQIFLPSCVASKK